MIACDVGQSAAQCRPGGTGAQVQHYFSDRLGSVMAVTNTSGQVLQHLIYTPFGVHLRGDATGQPFRFTGQRHDPETGLHYYRARYYSADLGRFLSVDPIGYADQWNLYAYVHNDPLSFTDPTGMDSFAVCRSAVGRADHCFIVVTYDEGDERGEAGSVRERFSYGPQNSGLPFGSLVNLTGTPTDTDRDDELAWANRDTDGSITVRSLTELGFSDDAVIASGRRVNEILGTPAAPGPTSYHPLPNSMGHGYGNSNSGARAVIEGARRGGEGQVNLRLTRPAPGWSTPGRVGQTAPPPTSSSCLRHGVGCP